MSQLFPLRQLLLRRPGDPRVLFVQVDQFHVLFAHTMNAAERYVVWFDTFPVRMLAQQLTGTAAACSPLWSEECVQIKLVEHSERSDHATVRVVHALLQQGRLSMVTLSLVL